MPSERRYFLFFAPLRAEALRAAPLRARVPAPLRAEALRAAPLRARVRTPLRAEALRAAPLRARVAAPFLAALFLRALFFAAAIVSLHDEVKLSAGSDANRRILHRVLTGTRCHDVHATMRMCFRNAANIECKSSACNAFRRAPSTVHLRLFRIGPTHGRLETRRTRVPFLSTESV